MVNLCTKVMVLARQWRKQVLVELDVNLWSLSLTLCYHLLVVAFNILIGGMDGGVQQKNGTPNPLMVATIEDWGFGCV